MKSLIYTTAAFMFLLIVFSCQQDVSKVKVSDKFFPLQKDYEYINLIPDSLWTPEQRLLVYKLTGIIAENIANENDSLVLKLTKEEMIAKGIPEPYYNLLLNNVIELNALEETGKISIDSIISMVRTAHRQNDSLKFIY